MSSPSPNLNGDIDSQSDISFEDDVIDSEDSNTSLSPSSTSSESREISVSPPLRLDDTYYYRRGRSFSFKILVEGVDHSLEAPAPLLCVVSGYFSQLSELIDPDDDDFDFMHVNVERFTPDIVRRVMELIYHLDTPHAILRKIADTCRISSEEFRRMALDDILAILALASEWRVTQLVETMQRFIINDGLLRLYDVDYVYQVARQLNATLLTRACDDYMSRQMYFARSHKYRLST